MTRAASRSEIALDAPRLPARAGAPVCAVIVHYRCEDALRACLASLAEHAPEVDVIVVENASGDGAAERLRGELAGRARSELLISERNGGFGAGCNLGIERALARHPGLEHVLLLNPDAILEPGCIEALRASAKRHPEAGVIGGRVLDESGERVLFENGRIRPWTLTRCHVAAPADERDFETEFITGALMLVDAALLRSGLRFDESFFLYVEDMDFGCEVRSRGRTLRITLDARIRHLGGASHSREAPVLGELRATQLREMTRSKRLFANKRLSFLHRCGFTFTALFLKPLAALITTRSTAFWKPYITGWRSASD